MRLTNDERAILLGLLEDMADEEDIEQQPMDIKETIVSVIGKLGGTYFGKLNDVAKNINDALNKMEVYNEKDTYAI